MSAAKKSLIGSVVIYLALIWFISALFTNTGLFFFAFSVLVLAGCLVAARRGKRQPLFVLYLLTTMAAAALALGEASLRVAPQLVSGAIANHTYGGYYIQPGGIYRRDAHLGYALKPNCARTMYWNGHWWKHETNADAYRGAAVESSDILFLGDSMIYGHGIEDEQTVSSQFQKITGRTAANLGQQGMCLVQMEMRLRHIGVKLRPRTVVVCSHWNDIPEASEWYPEAELNRYLTASTSDECEIDANRHCQPRPWWRMDELWNMHVTPALRFARALDGLARIKMGVSIQPTNISATRELFVPTREWIDKPFAPWESSAETKERLGWQIHVRALERINELCKQNDARLVLIDLGYPQAFSRAVEENASRLGAMYVPAGQTALRRAQAGEEMYLANDGHWSPLGCRVVAEELAARLKE